MEKRALYFVGSLFLVAVVLTAISFVALVLSVIFYEYSFLLAAWFFAPFFASLSLILGWVCGDMRRSCYPRRNFQRRLQ